MTNKIIISTLGGFSGLTASTVTYTGNTANNYGSVYGYAAATNPQQTLNQPNIQAKESNMDLLTG